MTEASEVDGASGTVPRVSELSDAATVRLVLADYAAIDPANKVNIIGSGLNILGFNREASVTAPFALVVSVRVPPTYYEAECSVEIVLEDPAGTQVLLPGPTGEAQPMRVGQAVRFDRPSFQGIHVPQGAIHARSQWVLYFSGGLPLSVGQPYVWRVRIDHESRDDWTEEFFVPGPVAGPVIG